MHLTLCFLSWALFLSGSLAEMCFECANEPGGDTACVEGMFHRNALPSSVKITNCEGGCQKMVIAMKDLGLSMYKRGCADPILNENICYNPKSNIAEDILKDFWTLPLLINVDIDQTTCVCHGDYCNGAATLTSRQAIMGVVAGVLAIFLMQH